MLGTCPPLTAPKNGSIDCEFGDDGFPTRWDSCTFTCDPGFELYGSSTRKCLAWWGWTIWTGREARCIQGTV